MNVKDYRGNRQFATRLVIRYCWRCQKHKHTANGKVIGKLKLFHCQECLPK